VNPRVGSIPTAGIRLKATSRDRTPHFQEFDVHRRQKNQCRYHVRDRRTTTILAAGVTCALPLALSGRYRAIPLALINEAWSDLPEAVKSSIMMLVKAAQTK
jgi:hypothetical protein